MYTVQKSGKMWWLIGRAPAFWSRGLGFASGISHNNPGALHSVKSQGRGVTFLLRKENIHMLKIYIFILKDKLFDYFCT